VIADQKRLLGGAGEKSATEAAATIELKSRTRVRERRRSPQAFPAERPGSADGDVSPPPVTGKRGGQLDDAISAIDGRSVLFARDACRACEQRLAGRCRKRRRVRRVAGALSQCPATGRLTTTRCR